LRVENGRDFAVFGCLLMCRGAAARMWLRDCFRF
jgi:hypothetical protein